VTEDDWAGGPGRVRLAGSRIGARMAEVGQRKASASSGIRLVRMEDHGHRPGLTETARPDRLPPALLEEGPVYLVDDPEQLG